MSKSTGPLGETVAAKLVELEYVDVEVARRARHPLKPAELRAPERQLLGRKHAAQLAQDGARAPDGDPEVVQELRVDIGERQGRIGNGATMNLFMSGFHPQGTTGAFASTMFLSKSVPNFDKSLRNCSTSFFFSGGRSKPARR